MGATKFEFRLRVAIISAILIVGFWAPWISAWSIGFRFPLWAWLVTLLSRSGFLSSSVAAPLVIILAALIAAKGAALRIWGTAYLGSATVSHPKMQAGAVQAEGPYRYVRNPLYLGSWCIFAAMAFLMPPTGALFVAVFITIFQMRLIFGEEAFLAAQLGEPYREYLRAVPRLVPHLRTIFSRASHVPASSKPRWIRAVLAEINAIGVFIALAFFSWSYNNWLMIKVIIISFGVSMVVRALMPAVRQQKSLQE